MTTTGESISTGRAPVIFVGHGNPTSLDDTPWLGELHAWAATMPRPKSILIFSAHWEASPLALAATRTVPLIYDFYGFPEHYYRVTYPAPGAPALAGRVRELLRSAGIEFVDEPQRGLDHGAFTPLSGMYPEADIPVLEASMPSLEPRTLFALGETLAPLRDEDVLIIGAGFFTHNMRAARSSTPQWALDFDAWIADVLLRGDLSAMLDYRTRAPGVDLALPTHEHFAPVLIAAGAASRAKGQKVRFPITGFQLGSFTRRSVQWG